jgi:hypothetical protein
LLESIFPDFSVLFSSGSVVTDLSFSRFVYVFFYCFLQTFQVFIIISSRPQWLLKTLISNGLHTTQQRQLSKNSFSYFINRTGLNNEDHFQIFSQLNGSHFSAMSTSIVNARKHRCWRHRRFSILTILTHSMKDSPTSSGLVSYFSSSCKNILEKITNENRSVR